MLDPITRKVSGEIELEGIQATAAHVHTGAFGVNGPVLIGLEDHGGHGHYTVPAGTVMAASDVDKLRVGGLYFNAHSAAHVGGEIRGQIGRRILLAAASGAQEVPEVVTAATGRGFVAYDAATRHVEGTLTVADVAATAAHIHQAAAGANGGIIMNLAPTAAGNSIWVVPATAAALTFDQARALLAEDTYFNAHSAAHVGGEIRGQLRAAPWNSTAGITMTWELVLRQGVLFAHLVAFAIAISAVLREDWMLLSTRRIEWRRLEATARVLSISLVALWATGGALVALDVGLSVAAIGANVTHSQGAGRPRPHRQWVRAARDRIPDDSSAASRPRAAPNDRSVRARCHQHRELAVRIIHRRVETHRAVNDALRVHDGLCVGRHVRHRRCLGVFPFALV